MQCKHGYYQFRDGKLVCSVCGKSAEEIKSGVEDKIAKTVETKQISQPEINKINRQKRR